MTSIMPFLKVEQYEQEGWKNVNSNIDIPTAYACYTCVPAAVSLS
jgi:hypothetical protein